MKENQIVFYILVTFKICFSEPLVMETVWSVQVQLFYVLHFPMSGTILRFSVVLQTLSRIQDVFIDEFGYLIQIYKLEIKTCVRHQDVSSSL